MKFDLHLHTNRHSPDSQIHPLALFRRAQKIGLNGLVITEHDWLWTEEELRIAIERELKTEKSAKDISAELAETSGWSKREIYSFINRM